MKHSQLSVICALLLLSILIAGCIQPPKPPMAIWEGFITGAWSWHAYPLPFYNVTISGNQPTYTNAYPYDTITSGCSCSCTPTPVGSQCGCSCTSDSNANITFFINTTINMNVTSSCGYSGGLGQSCSGTTRITNNTHNISITVPSSGSVSQNLTVTKNGSTVTITNGTTTLNFATPTVYFIWSGSGSSGSAYAPGSASFTGLVTFNTTILKATINSISITPANVTQYFTLYCNLTASNLDSDPMNVTVNWYKNGINQTSLATTYLNLQNNTATVVANVTSGNLSINDIWSCTASVFDGVTNSEWLSSPNITITAAPVINVISVVPVNATQLTTVYCEMNVTDAEQTQTNITGNWSRNGVKILAFNYSNLNNSTVVNVATLNTYLFTVGDNISCEAVARDGIGYSLYNTSINTTILLSNNSIVVTLGTNISTIRFAPAYRFSTNVGAVNQSISVPLYRVISYVNSTLNISMIQTPAIYGFTLKCAPNFNQTGLTTITDVYTIITSISAYGNTSLWCWADFNYPGSSSFDVLIKGSD